MEDYSYTHLLLPVSRLDVESGVEEEGLLNKGSLVQPPYKQVLGPLDTMHGEVPQMEGGQHKTEPPGDG